MYVSDLKGVGEKRLQDLNSAGIFTVRDLLLQFPASYRDLTHITPLSDVRAGGMYAINVTVASPATQAFAKGLMITRTVVSDGTGEMTCVWYNQPWMKGNLSVGRSLLLYGRVEMKGKKLQMASPAIETETGMQSVYKAIGSVPPKTVKQLIDKALSSVRGTWKETLPNEIINRFHLMSAEDMLFFIHQPKDACSLKDALYRHSFENLLLFQIAAGLMRTSGRQGIAIKVDSPDEFLKTLPFPPTNAQRRVLFEIANDLKSPSAMARLVQGDVGCGKTAVAFGAMYLACKKGYQCAMMAPTEILARQHFESAKEALEPLGIACGLLTGSMTKKEHVLAKEKIASGQWQAVFGTHALITEDVSYRQLGLVITDEQHRFGVRQRTMLSEKGAGVNVLVMSATPIPRTLSLILYGDLDISVIDEMPAGRKPVKTRIVPEEKRNGMYGFIRKEVQSGRQIYFVCPLVEESEAIEAVSAEDLYEHLKNDIFPDLTVCLVHGKMKSKDKDQEIEDFRTGKTNIMVSTTVIEVGVNVPNATVMVIENAERFGLAQLHQLRGRVGRGGDEAWCFLMANSNERLKTMCETNDGFVIAQKDMELRGPGEIFGTRQSGSVMSELLSENTDANMLKTTHELAREILKRNDADETKAQLVSLANAWLKEKGQIVLSAN
ncbi:MAG: ATP-dependent DNA helicase RecG [Clostridiales bacterium]|nr:ATP-dependent DNA helicase RecG [Clostridiales bacterium]